MTAPDDADADATPGVLAAAPATGDEFGAAEAPVPAASEEEEVMLAECLVFSAC